MTTPNAHQELFRRTRNTVSDGNDGEVVDPSISEGATPENDEELTRVYSQSVRQELTRIASNFGNIRTHDESESDTLQRKDTLAGLKVGDDVFDPKSPNFDVYKWTRM